MATILMIMILISIVFSIAMSYGMDDMIENHPDYNGEDIFEENENEQK